MEGENSALDGLKERKVPRWVYVVYVPFLFFAIFHAIISRTPKEFLTHWLYFFVILFVILVAAGVAIFIRDRPRLVAKEFIIGVPSAIFVCAFCGFVLYVLGVSVKDSLLASRGWFSSFSAHSVLSPIVAVIIVNFLGGTLFLARLKFRFCYGLTESLIGVYIGIHRLTGAPVIALPSTPDFFIIVLTASLYLIVRGFDNMHQGLSSEPKDILAQRAIQWMRHKI